MFAVVKTGGKQYLVKEGMTLDIERLPNEAGETLKLNQVLMLSKDEQVTMGAPFIDGAAVEAKVVAHGKSPKISILKFKRRKHHMKRAGHRQQYTKIIVEKILH